MLRDLLTLSDRERTNLRICQFIALFSMMGFSIIYPGLWFYLHELGVNTIFYGMVVGGYALGTALASPIFGLTIRWSYRWSLILSTMLILISSLIYVAADNIWFIFAVRVVQGIGAGNNTILQTYVSVHSPIHKRTKMLARLGSAASLGYIIGPLVGIALSFVPDFRIGPMLIHGIATIGFFTAFCQLGILIAIIFYFSEDEEIRPKINDQDSDDEIFIRNDARQCSTNWCYSTTRLTFLALAYFLVAIISTTYETLVTPISYYIFDWGRFEISLVWTGISVVSYLTYQALIPTTRRFEDSWIMAFGSILQIVGTTCLIRYSGYLENWRFLFSGGILIVGFSLSIVLIESLYSKDLDVAETGKMMGILVSAGGFARTIAPAAFGYIYHSYGQDHVFIILSGTSGLIFLILMTLHLIHRYKEGRP